MEETKKVPHAIMHGSPEVLALNTLTVRSKSAKRVLDIGTFTGASALAAALGFSDPDSKVITCDVNSNHLELAKRHWRIAGVEDKIQFELGPATETLERLIDQGQAGTYDFAFIDADKVSYDDYYEKCLTLLKSGGVLGHR